MHPAVMGKSGTTIDASCGNHLGAFADATLADATAESTPSNGSSGLGPVARLGPFDPNAHVFGRLGDNTCIDVLGFQSDPPRVLGERLASSDQPPHEVAGEFSLLLLCCPPPSAC